jgi:hypothetical protein
MPKQYGSYPTCIFRLSPRWLRAGHSAIVGEGRNVGPFFCLVAASGVCRPLRFWY